MSTRLNRALAEGERHSPDPTEVLAGIRAGVRRSRRRRRFAVAGAASAAVLVLAGGGFLVQRLPIPPVGATPATDRVDAAAAAGPVQPQPCRLSFGWLPTNLAAPMRTCGPGDQRVLYPMDGGPYLRVDVDYSGWQPPLSRNGWEPVVVNGRTGRMAVQNTRALVLFPLPSGRWVDFEYGVGQPGGPRTEKLGETAKRIAEGIGETVAGTVRVPFAPTYLPRGQRFVAALGGTASGLIYREGSGRVLDRKPAQGATEDGIPTDRPTIDYGVGYSIRWDPAGSEPTGRELGERADRDVQGLPTYLVNRGRTVIVDGFHGGRLSVFLHEPEWIRPTAPSAPPTGELLRIAEGIRWTG
ncbi:hypothetical protein C5N14_04805 [Micromonospora sp. MW-13]|uniref:hypothetical protein n=1 Tax=Micromonospora sp. MW-13 TaxID=2094022 RepID=UPI000ED1512E|nr:hypothetical protein [Micromonospora sp. MW-13]RGC69725.1 hypothetical protein C5N14_04805 [Micromonospora sp. MW-13]